MELEDLVLRLLLGLFLNRIYDWFEGEFTKCSDFIMEPIQSTSWDFFTPALIVILNLSMQRCPKFNYSKNF